MPGTKKSARVLSITPARLDTDPGNPFSTDTFAIGLESPTRKALGSTILIVDDVQSNRGFLVTILRYHGHRVLEAADGREGLAVAQLERPDLIITDVLMPVMDGYELLRQLRLDPLTDAIPVVFYTAHYGGREAKALALSSGVSHVLTKPVDSKEVLEVVARLLAPTPEPTILPVLTPLAIDFDRQHLRLLTDKLSEKVGDLITANGRLRALINIGVELASTEDSEDRLHRLCTSARDLFGASLVTLGTVNRTDRRLQRLVMCGSEEMRWIAVGDSIPGILGRAVTERRAFRGNNPTGDPAKLDLPRLHPTIQAFLAAPIASSARVYGWICLVRDEGRTFTEDDEHLLMVLSEQVGRIFELQHEVRERQQAESAVRRERDKAQRYLDTAAIILLALDLEGRITLVNPHACAMLGWTAEELRGRLWTETCVPERLQTEVSRRFDNLVHGDLALVENAVVTRSGQERLIEWRNTLLKDDTGTVIGTFSSGADVTERNRAVNALKTAEERMRFALQSADVGIWDMDYVSGLLQWSETMEAQYGFTSGGFPGTFEAFVARMHPEDRDAFLQTVGAAVASGGDFSVENRSVWPDGTIRWLRGAGRIVLKDDGTPLRGIGISLDVTDRRKLEEQYQQAQKMDAVGRLAGGVAHDFNNLLTVILGNCELALAGLEPADLRHLDIMEIQKAGLSAAGLTRQLLAFSRKQIIEPTLVDVNAVVGEMRGMLERLIREDVHVVMALGHDLSLVKADRGQLEQVVVNLAVNARDAMPLGGTLTIETATIDLDEHYAETHLAVKPGRYVALTVTDSGTGMTPEVQARLFEPFFTTKEVGKGTGLGLATVFGIVAANGGSVNVYSEVGKGTSFKVYFPIATAADTVVEIVPPAVRSRTKAETVLVVEDAEGLRDLTRRLLELQGYTVLVAASADEARQVFDVNPSIDVILTDVVMPGASGPELTRQLIEQRPDLKVIYMSGYTEDAIVHHGVLKAGIAFLNKPFTSEALGLKIREVLDR